MLATVERLNVLSESELLAKKILQSEIAGRYLQLHNTLRVDPISQKRIAAFAQMKELYEEVQRFGRYHPEHSRVTKEIRQLKREVDLDKNVANFRVAENELQDLLDQVGIIVGQSVSEHIKVATGNPFFESGGACSTGGSCG